MNTVDMTDKALAILYLQSHGETIVEGMKIEYASGRTDSYTIRTGVITDRDLRRANTLSIGLSPWEMGRAASRMTARIIGITLPSKAV